MISKHIKNIFEEGEHEKEGNVQIMHIANSDKPVEFYAIISVGYRVKSKCGTQFRIWATRVLKEYMRKGKNLEPSDDYFLVALLMFIVQWNLPPELI